MYVRILQNFLEHKSMLLIIHMKEVLKEIHIFLTKSRKNKNGQNKKRQSVLSIPHMKGESGEHRFKKRSRR
jgi:hypothetical protein